MWAPQWLPIDLLDRSTDNTYLVRIENVGGYGIGPGWIDKGYFDGCQWVDEANNGLERGPWKITAFASWPELSDIEVSHASSCAVHNEPAMSNGPCDCGAELRTKSTEPALS